MNEGESRGEFTIGVRHYCRNPKCRTKLPTPIANTREAFCPDKTCRERFYRLRCYVCEEKKPGRLDAHTCGRRKCKNALRTLVIPNSPRRVEIASGNSIESGLPERGKDPPGWRIVAGELSPDQFHCATVPDGPLREGKPRWAGGSFERIEAENRRTLKAANDKALIQPRHMPVNIGYLPNYRVLKNNNGSDAGKHPDPVIPGFGYDRHAARKCGERAKVPLPDDLSIPDFLARPNLRFTRR